MSKTDINEVEINGIVYAKRNANTADEPQPQSFLSIGKYGNGYDNGYGNGGIL